LRITELVGAEFHGERAGVVLDRRDVVDRLAKALLQEPVEGRPLDVDQVGKVENVLETRETRARARRSDRGGQVIQPPLEMRCELATAGGQTWAAKQRRNPPGDRKTPLPRQGTPAASAWCRGAVVGRARRNAQRRR